MSLESSTDHPDYKDQVRSIDNVDNEIQSEKDLTSADVTLAIKERNDLDIPMIMVDDVLKSTPTTPVILRIADSKVERQDSSEKGTFATWRRRYIIAAVVGISGLVIGLNVSCRNGRCRSAPTVGRSIVESQKLLLEGGRENYFFGMSLSVYQSTLVVGSPGIGAAYVYNRVEDEDENVQWIQEAELLRPSGLRNFGMGQAVGVWDNHIVVGDAINKGVGSAYLFEGSNGTWTYVETFNNDLMQPMDRFGSTVEIRKGVVVVGSTFDYDNGEQTGAAYVYSEDASTGNWSNGVKLFPSDPTEGLRFGGSVALEDDLLVIGGIGNESVPGAAYIYERDETGRWIEQTKLQSPDVAQTQFGKSVAIENRTIVVGANAWNSKPGLVYVYDWNDDDQSWKETSVLRASDNTGNFDEFGDATKIHKGRILVSASKSVTVGRESGGAYLFEKVDGVWVETFKFQVENPIHGDQVGEAAAFFEDAVILGARLHDDKTGAAFIYEIPTL